MLVSAAEPPILRALGLFSPLCEQHGADFLVVGKFGLTGIQRKTTSDLVASLRDGRIFDLVTKGDALACQVLLIEGRFRWDHEGIDPHTGFTAPQLLGLRLSLQRKHGIVIVETESLEETAALLPRIERFFENEDRVSSLLAVPKSNGWSDPKKATGLRVWQCVPSISLGGANELWEAFGCLPLALTVTDAELKAVKGMGPKRIRSIKETFSGTTHSPD